MSEFVARIGNVRGEVVERPFSAENEETLRRELDGKGFYVFTVRKRSSESLFRRLRRKNRVPRREFMLFNHEIATLLKAGLPLLQGLDILLERMVDPMFREVVRDIRDKVKGGTSLSEAFGEYSEYFPPLYATSLQAGERSGELESVIRSYIRYAKVMDVVRKRVNQALIYPGFLFGTSGLVIWVLLTYAMPNFQSLYESFNTPLPTITVAVLSISNTVNQHRLATVCIAIASIIAFKVAWDSERGRRYIDRVKLRIPFVGSIWQKFAVSQLTRALETLLKGGIPLVTAIDVAAGSVSNRVVAEGVQSVVQDIREGESLSVALEATGVMQPMVIEMVRVGESTGAMAEMLGNIADYYDEDIEEDLTRFLTILEPLLLVGMGGIIALLLLAMYIPIFELQSAIQ